MIANPTDATPVDQIPAGVVTNPVLDEIYRAHDSMTPNAQAAVARAHEIASGPAAAGPDPLRVPTPAAPVEPKTAMTAPVMPPVSGESVEAPGAAGDGLAPHAMEPVAVANPDGTVQSSLQRAGIGNTVPQAPVKQTASQRLSDMQTKGSGISQIKRPWLRVPLQILDAVASSVAPSLTMGIPGTAMHHLAVERGLERQVGDEQSQQKAKNEASTAESENTLRTAQASNANAEADEHTQQAEALRHNPKPTNEWIQLTEPVVDPLHPEIGPQIAFANKNDPKQGLVYGNAPVAAKPTEHKPPTNEIEAWLAAPENKSRPVMDVLKDFWEKKATATGEEKAKPLTAGTAATLNSAWNSIAPKYKLAADPFREGMSDSEVKHVQDSMNSIIQRGQGAQNIIINQSKAADAKQIRQDAATTKAANDVHKRLTSGFDKLVAQSDALDQAIAEIGGNAPGQAVGTIKSIVGLAGGQGSGVRITQAELDSLVHSRGLADTFGGWISQLSGTGKMDANQVKQIKEVLQSAKDKADEKRQTYFDSLKELGGAPTVTAVHDIENRFNESMMGGGAAGNKGAPTVVNTKEEYDAIPKGSSYVDAQDHKTYVKK